VKLDLLHKSSILGFLAGHSEVIRSSLATPALLGLAAGCGAHKSIDCIVLGIFWFDIFAISIFFWGVLGVSFLKFELSFALKALNKVAHLSNGLILQILKLFVSEESSNLILHHVVSARFFETLEVSSLIYEL
jgi:hypothetical protein